ncbi:MAG: hypothetical protein HY259_03560 [Chloroflexi bacterium]|nr:hypothetical protein [Chloroflexota bacterium]MBI3732518.1 hypothetical protein [Chloroflexota bacterium]
MAPSPSNSVVTAIAGMTASRAAHTATLLPDGQVLIAGGFDAEHGLSSAELFDPATRTFSPTGPMSVARYSHTATLLPNGKVLIAGGYNGDYLSSAELYDPAARQFIPAGQMTVARHDQLAVLLSSGKVLLVGGVGVGYEFLSSAELYDPATGAFALTGSMATPREGHMLTLLADGRALITGGHQGRHSEIIIHASAEIYNPATGAFTPTGSMTLKRHKHDATLLSNGKVLISGGSDERDDRGAYRSAETYDPQTGIFTWAGNMTTARYKHQGTSVLLKDGRVLLMGGAASAELYDPATGVFNPLSTGTGAMRLFATTTLLPDGAVLLTGGYGPNIAASAKAWLFIP